MKYKIYRVFIKYCVFSFKFCDFSELCQLCCSAGFLPAWCVCTHTDTEGKQRNARVGSIFKNSEKTQYLINTLYINLYDKLIVLFTGTESNHLPLVQVGDDLLLPPRPLLHLPPHPLIHFPPHPLLNVQLLLVQHLHQVLLRRPWIPREGGPAAGDQPSHQPAGQCGAR